MPSISPGSWRLSCADTGARGLLASYQIERHGNARKLLERVGPATRMADLHSPLSVEMRNHAIRFLGLVGLDNAMAETVSMLDVAYRDSAIVEEGHLGWFSGAPHAGERARRPGDCRPAAARTPGFTPCGREIIAFSL